MSHGRRRMSSDDGHTLLVIDAPQHDAAAYYLSGFLAPDPVIFLQAAGKKYLAVSSMEYGRAEKQARVDELLSFDELDVTNLARELKSGGRAYAAAAANLLKSLGASSVTVPPTLGVIYADELRARGIDASPNGKVFSDLRRAKTAEEISRIEKDRKSTRLNSSHANISYAVFCLKKK